MARRLLVARFKDAAAPLTTKSTLSAGAAEDDEKLEDGYMRLYGYYAPALEGGGYTVSATQEITAYKFQDKEGQTTQRTTLYNRLNDQSPVLQHFNVVAPQFSLDPNLINSYYPPSGHSDEGRILPHIVFNDPHVPWLRNAGKTKWATEPIAHPPDALDWKGRSQVPWMALMVFEPADLVFDKGSNDPSEIGLAGLDCWKNAASKPPINGTYDMTAAEYLTLTSRVLTEHDDTIDDTTVKTKIIFPTKTMIQDVFGNDQDSLDPLNALQMLCHVRHVSNKGMPDADPHATTFYSVQISSMSGDATVQQSTAHIVHLVSIENMDFTISQGLKGPSDRIAVISLFSWVYSCTPETVDFTTTMTRLAAQSQPLRAPDTVIESLQGQIDQNAAPSSEPTSSTAAQNVAKAALVKRLNHGYTIARWRASTGEESIAFNRGPLTPIHPPLLLMSNTTDGSTPDQLPYRPTDDWPIFSMTGKDYLIFDRSVGTLDATYASAWALGKLMAISDGTFTAALLRFRSRTTTIAQSNAMKAANKVSGIGSVLQNVVSAVPNAGTLVGGGFEGDVARIRLPAGTVPPKSMTHSQVKVLSSEAIKSAVQERSASSAGTVHTGLDGNAPVDSDWEVIMNWVHDSLYLAHIPAHYLFPDPSFLRMDLQPDQLPKDLTKLHPEALRFFSIDDIWLDCFIDGGLSTANHTDPQEDAVRQAVKFQINTTLSAGGPTSIAMPVPRSGFVIRSAAIKATPDLKVAVTQFHLVNGAWIEDTGSDALLRHTRLDDFTILSLVECPLAAIAKITLTQPPHQQRFAYSLNLIPDVNSGTTSFTGAFKISQLYTNEDKAPKVDGKPVSWPWESIDAQFQPTDETPFYTKRCIRADLIAKRTASGLTQWNQANGGVNGPYTETVPDSCVVGFQLGDPVYQMEVFGRAPASTETFPAATRQLWMGKSHGPKVAAVVTPDKSRKIPKGPPKRPKLDLPPTAPSTSTTQPKQQPQLHLNHTPVANQNSILSEPFTPSRKPNQPPTGNWADCQFELLLHPDYRQPPPRPQPSQEFDSNTFDSNALYSAQAQLPIAPLFLYDLVLAVRRRPHHTPGTWQLQKITIEIPVQDPSQVNSDTDNMWREPLLVNENYAGRGVRMTGNQRFIPTLDSRLSSDDGKECLCITLTPRTGQAEGTMLLDDSRASADASVRLATVRLAPIVDTSKTARIAQPHDSGSVSSPVGICFVKMTEKYASGQQDQNSWAVALKTASQDQAQ